MIRMHLTHCRLALVLGLTLAVAVMSSALAGSGVTLGHVSGLAYSADGEQLIVAGDDALAVYADGRWTKMPGPPNGCTSFSGTHAALYCNGHAASSAQHREVSGLMTSRNGGRSWQNLGPAGDSDLHTLATSYGGDGIYVFNDEPNRRMGRAGIYYSLNAGLQWQRADATGLTSRINSLAVHPSDPRTIAAGANTGLYLSRDSGDNFEQLVAGGPVLGEDFD
nr:glycosyl hydrolase [Pseudomonadota bacterium]